MTKSPVIALGVYLLTLGSTVMLQAATITLNFEGFPDSTILTNQYPGLTFTNAQILSAGISLNEFEFPPHLGTNVVSDNGGPITITFSTQVQSFSGYFTYLNPLTITALGPGNTLVASAHSLFSNNLACLGGPPCSGDPGSSSNELLQVTSSSTFSSVTISGNPAGGSFVLDDLTISGQPASAVPEPGTLPLVISGMAVYAVIRKKKHSMKTILIFGGIGVVMLLAGGVWLIAAPQDIAQHPHQDTSTSLPAVSAAAAAQTIGAPLVLPSVVPIHSTLPVSVTASLSDPSLIPLSVTALLSEDGASTLQFPMFDDGSHGDMVAGDHIYTVQIPVSRSSPTSLHIQVSIALRGNLKRILSPGITVRVTLDGTAPLPPDPGAAGKSTLAGIDSLPSG